MSFSVKYYMVLTLIVVLTQAYVITTRVEPSLKSAALELITELKANYPADLEIKVTNGQISVNRPQPFIVPLPKKLKVGGNVNANYNDSFANVDNLVVFDSAGTLDDFTRYKTLILVNSKNIMQKSNNGTTTVRSLAEVKDFTLNAPLMIQGLDKLAMVASYIWRIIYILVVVLLALVVYLVTPLVMLSVAGFYTLFSKLSGVELTFRKAYQIALHTYTLPITLMLVLSLLKMTQLSPFLFWLMQLGFGWAVIATLKHTPELVN